jgi:hypothetical protein
MMQAVPPSQEFERAQGCVELQIQRELYGWKVGERVQIKSARGLTVDAVIRTFTCDGNYQPLVVVEVAPRGWLEAVPVKELQRPAGEAPSAFHQREVERLRARKVLCSFDPRA